MEHLTGGEVVTMTRCVYLWGGECGFELQAKEFSPW